MSRCTSMIRNARLSLLALSAVIGASLGGCAATPPRAFDSPERATEALVAALCADDRAALFDVLGGDADKVLGSGDQVADRDAVATFLESYERRHALERTDDSASIVVGDNGWPMPIPIVRDSKGLWSFDTETGAEEIIDRRVGRNELDTIETCRAITDAQREYVLMDPDGDGRLEYAGKFLSDPGTRNGLFWETAEGEAPSPLGPLIAEATEEGYRMDPADTSDEPRAYHGYRYRILTEQGPDAPGGAYPYLIGGRMRGGFGAVAWPVRYGHSGVMTFIVGVDGVVYEKDLGSSTSRAASRMKAFNPGDGWRVAEGTGAAGSSGGN